MGGLPRSRCRSDRLPWYLTVRLSLVNRQLLQAADLEVPPQRWSQVPAFARRIRERTGRYGLFVTAVPDDSAELLESLVQMGVRLLDSRRRAALPPLLDARPFVSGPSSTARACRGKW